MTSVSNYLEIVFGYRTVCRSNQLNFASSHELLLSQNRQFCIDGLCLHYLHFG